MKGFVLRIAPSGHDRVAEALAANQLIIGWSYADVLDPALDWVGFCNRLRSGSNLNASNQSIGGQAGNMWRFVREMDIGDLVCVPHGPDFYVAKVTGPATYDAALVADDTAYRRPCEWLNGKKPIPRVQASSGLQWRLKARQTCVNATDLLPDIQAALADSAAGARPDFHTDLTIAVRDTLRSSKTRMNDWEFERIVQQLFERLGAKATITARRNDKGDDVVAEFGALGLKIVAQAKYHPDPAWKTGAGALEQLLQGMAEQDADIGWLVTCGAFGFDVQAEEARLAQEGRRVRFVEGDQLAALMVELGVGPTRFGVKPS